MLYIKNKRSYKERNCRPCQHIFANIQEVYTLCLSKIASQRITSIPWPLFWPLVSRKMFILQKFLQGTKNFIIPQAKIGLYTGCVRTWNYSVVDIDYVSPTIWGLVLLCSSMILALNFPFLWFLMFVCYIMRVST